jgi:hypothetical protein
MCNNETSLRACLPRAAGPLVSALAPPVHPRAASTSAPRRFHNSQLGRREAAKRQRDVLATLPAPSSGPAAARAPCPSPVHPWCRFLPLLCRFHNSHLGRREPAKRQQNFLATLPACPRAARPLPLLAPAPPSLHAAFPPPVADSASPVAAAAAAAAAARLLLCCCSRTGRTSAARLGQARAALVRGGRARRVRRVFRAVLADCCGREGGAVGRGCCWGAGARLGRGAGGRRARARGSARPSASERARRGERAREEEGRERPGGRERF